MKITSVETITVSAGWKNWLFVRVHTDGGLHGIGEGTLNGFIRTTEAAVRELEHLVIGQEPRNVNALATRLMESVSLDGGHIHRTAVAAIEVACWDILGKSLGVPIYQLFGGKVRESILGYANGWYRTERSPECFAQAAEKVLEKGFHALKLDPLASRKISSNPMSWNLATILSRRSALVLVKSLKSSSMCTQDSPRRMRFARHTS